MNSLIIWNKIISRPWDSLIVSSSIIKQSSTGLINYLISIDIDFSWNKKFIIYNIRNLIEIIICLQFDIFRFKRLPIVKMIPLSMTYCGFVVFTNLSLQYNTVGTYQVIKVLTAPCVMVLSYIFYQKKYSFKVQLTLVSNWCT